MRNFQVFVKGFPSNTKQKDLQKIFQKVGTIKQVRIVKNFAFVEYGNIQSAKAAVQQLNNTSLQGQNIRVELAQRRTKDRKKIIDRERDTCRNCGNKGHWQRDCPEKDRRRYRERSREAKRRPRSYSYSSQSSQQSRSRSRRNRRPHRRSPPKESYSRSSSSSSSYSSRSYSSYSRFDKQFQKKNTQMS